MDDDKKQESQKTVVAFVAGLLIGGLLVWVFSPAPEEAPALGENDSAEEEMMDTDEESEMPETPRATTTDDEEEAPVVSSETPAVPVEVGEDYTVAIANQAAGDAVLLGEIAFPVVEGWVAVHETTAGDLGNALGAARFNTAAGLIPTSIPLLRSTVVDGTYAVVFYTDNGDRIFDLRTDARLVNAQGVVSATFVAQ